MLFDLFEQKIDKVLKYVQEFKLENINIRKRLYF